MRHLKDSSIFVLLEPGGAGAKPVFGYAENAKYRRYGRARADLAIDDHTSHDVERSTEIVDFDVFASEQFEHLALSLNPGPKDLSKGFVFGSDPQTCDILLARDKTSGVSGNHFSINVNWQSGNPVITCLTQDEGTGIHIMSASGSGWRLYSRAAFKEVEPKTTTIIRASETMKLITYNPGRNNQESIYSRILQEYFKRCRKAVPEMSHTRLYDLERTPLMISRTRGLTGRQYVTTNSIIGDKVVLCQVKGHQNWTADPKTFIVKRYRNTSQGWRNHARYKLSGLRSYRHQNIIMPEDIITDGTEFMPVYLLEPQETLADILARRRLLSEPQAGLLLAQVLEGLKFLHENDIVHGSLYPGSIRIKYRDPKHRDRWSVKLSDICLCPYVELDSQGKRQLYESQRNGLIITPTPLWDTWSAGVVALELLSSDGLPPRSPNPRSTQRMWTEALANRATAFFHHERPSPRGKKEAAQFLTRVLKVEFEQRLTAEECLQDPWLGLWRPPPAYYDREKSRDCDNPSSDEETDVKEEEESGDETDIVEEERGEDVEAGEPCTSDSKGKQPVYARRTGGAPARSPISKGKQPLHARRTGFGSSGHQLSDTPRSPIEERWVKREDDDTKGFKRSGPSK